MIAKPLLLPLPMAAPVAPLPSNELLMVVTAETPVEVLEPVNAAALSDVEPVAEVVPEALVPPLPLPFPPPAAATSPLEALELLSPFCPVAAASPLVEEALPWLLTWLVLAKATWMLESPPSMAPPLAMLPR
ncbi:MAG TPA: hypothetical protein VMW62_18045 [Chloroflexota bacterium]|nr:hypothetical protein [Chloroflexota bacterium]